MDSLTQVVLGGAVGYAVLGNKVGRKAAIYGAILEMLYSALSILRREQPFSSIDALPKGVSNSS